jgi:MFS family permease
VSTGDAPPDSRSVLAGPDPAVAFAIGYPTQLALFSASAGAAEQGWIMGVTIALFTLGSGLISLVGGAMMAVDARLPFLTAIASFVLALVVIAGWWRSPDVRALDEKERGLMRAS